MVQLNAKAFGFNPFHSGNSWLRIMRLVAKNKAARNLLAACIGLDGFEPSTPCPPDMYAKPLRYSPCCVGEPTVVKLSQMIDFCQ